MWYIPVVHQRWPHNEVTGKATNCNANICPSCSSNLSTVLVHTFQDKASDDILRNTSQPNPNNYHTRTRKNQHGVASPSLRESKPRSLNTACNENNKCLHNHDKYGLDHIHPGNTNYCTQNTSRNFAFLHESHNFSLLPRQDEV